MGDEKSRAVEVEVRDLSENIRALAERIEQLQRGPTNGHVDVGAPPTAESLRRVASEMLASGPSHGSSARVPFSFGRFGDVARAGSALARNDGKFFGEAKWWSAGYAQCEIWIDTDGGRRYLRGQGGGFLGAGAYSGDLYTGDLGKLLSTTASCQIVSAAFYVNITFWDAGSGNLGMYHGGGFGVGGGVFAGHWT